MTDAEVVDAQATAGAIPAEGVIPSGQTEQAPPDVGATPPSGDGEQQRLAAALKSEREARRKAEQAVKDLQQKQTDGLSETERLANRVTELEAATKAAEREALVLKISQEYSIPPQLSSRLLGSTEDELRADAEALKAAIPAQPPAPQTTQSVGGPQGPPSGTRSPEEWLGVIRGRH